MNGAIKRAGEKDAAKLDTLINREFAYKMLDKDKIVERMRRPEITVFKKIIGKDLAGFVEIEIFQDMGMVNALSVMESHRRRGFGRELLNHALEFLKENGVRTARLFVKKGNEKAKKLYTSCGFEFSEMHEHKIGGMVAEVWEKRLSSADGQNGYLN